MRNLFVVVEEVVLTSGVCEWRGQYMSNNTMWLDDCNQCQCLNSIATCTKVWCGLSNCLLQANPCEHNQVCKYLFYVLLVFIIIFYMLVL